MDIDSEHIYANSDGPGWDPFACIKGISLAHNNLQSDFPNDLHGMEINVRHRGGFIIKYAINWLH